MEHLLPSNPQEVTLVTVLVAVIFGTYKLGVLLINKVGVPLAKAGTTFLIGDKKADADAPPREKHGVLGEVAGIKDELHAGQMEMTRELKNVTAAQLDIKGAVNGLLDVEREKQARRPDGIHVPLTPGSVPPSPSPPLR